MADTSEPKDREPLEVLTLRLPARHLRLLDLLAYALSVRAGRPAGRGEALRKLVEPVFRALEEDTDVERALAVAAELGISTIRAMPRLVGGSATQLPSSLERALDALGVPKGPPGLPRLLGNLAPPPAAPRRGRRKLLALPPPPPEDAQRDGREPDPPRRSGSKKGRRKRTT